MVDHHQILLQANLKPQEKMAICLHSSTMLEALQQQPHQIHLEVVQSQQIRLVEPTLNP